RGIHLFVHGARGTRVVAAISRVRTHGPPRDGERIVANRGTGAGVRARIHAGGARCTIEEQVVVRVPEPRGRRLVRLRRRTANRRGERKACHDVATEARDGGRRTDGEERALHAHERAAAVERVRVDFDARHTTGTPGDVYASG